MGFLKSINKGLTAIGTGGLSELGGVFKNKTQTATQVPLETPEQQQARKLFLDFAKTGKFGNYQAGANISGYTPGADVSGYTPGAEIYPQAGQEYGGAMGSYDMTGLESAGQNRLMGLLQGGLPDIFNTGTSELDRLLTTDTYDPYSSTGIYSGYKQQAEREAQDAADSVKRNAAFGGTLYGSDTVRTLGRLGEVTSNNLQNKLAELYDTFAQRKLSAIPMALQAGQMGQELNMGLVGASQQYGGLSRILQDTDLQRKYGEAIRARTEGLGEATRRRGEVSSDAMRRRTEITSDAARRRAEQGAQVSALPSIFGSTTQYGVPSVEVPVANPWDKVLDLVARGVGQAAGARAG